MTVKPTCSLCGTHLKISELILGESADICAICVQLETILVLTNKLIDTPQARTRHIPEALFSTIKSYLPSLTEVPIHAKVSLRQARGSSSKKRTKR